MMSRIRKQMEKREEGFTLVELLVVIIIIGILAAIAIPLYLNQQAKAKDASLKSDLKNAQIEVANALVDDPTGATVSAAVAALPNSNNAPEPTVTGDITVGYTICGTVPGGAHAAGYCINPDGSVVAR